MMIEALLSLEGDDCPAVGHDRIRLLEGVAREGSIAAGAKAVGLSYKAAWHALDAMTDLFGQLALATRAGGRARRGARLKLTGVHLIEARRPLEGKLARLLRGIEPDLAGAGISPPTLRRGCS
jgi:molybdate transport system regulatory protein